MLFAEGVYTRELTEYGNFKLEAHSSEIIYYWREQDDYPSGGPYGAIKGIVSDNRVYVPQDEGRYEIRLGGWNLKVGIRIMF